MHRGRDGRSLLDEIDRAIRVLPPVLLLRSLGRPSGLLKRMPVPRQNPSMFKYTLNGPTNPPGNVNTGLGFILTHFPGGNTNSVKIKNPNGGKPIERPLNIGDVDRVVREALNFIDTHCAKSKTCNKYFLSLGSLTDAASISLRQILDEKHLQIFCLGGKEDKDVPAGYTHGVGPAYAQIGLNMISLTDSGNAAAVLLHELAHVAGAPGLREDAKSLAAENSLLYCFSRKLSKEFYNDQAFGMATDTKGSRQGMV